MSADAPVAVGKLSTRETLIREIQAAVKEQLYSGQSQGRGRVLNGPLGEQIAIAAGSLNLTSFVSPEHIAEGICNWLDKYFLQSPHNNGPREGHEDTSPPPCNGGGDGLRVASSDSSVGGKRERERLRDWLNARESSALVQSETADPSGSLRWIAAGRAEAYREVLAALGKELEDQRVDLGPERMRVIDAPNGGLDLVPERD